MKHQTFSIGIKAKLQHGELMKLVEHFGSQKALAEYLGLSQHMLGRMLNFQWLPLPDAPARSEQWRAVEEKLVLLTEKSFAEMFPVAARNLTSEVKTKLEVYKEVPLAELEMFQQRLLTESNVVEEAVFRAEMGDTISAVLDSLTPREADIIKMRFGLKPYDSEHLLEEVGEHFNIKRERVRQIEAKALRKLRHSSRQCKLEIFLPLDERKQLKKLDLEVNDSE